MAYNILCIDDDSEFLLTMKIGLRKKYDFFSTTSLAEGLQEIKRNGIDLVLLDITLGTTENGLEGLKQIKQLSPDIDVVMLTGMKDPKVIVETIRAGAVDYLCKPIVIEELIAIIEKHQSMREMKDRHNALINELNPIDSRTRLLGSSPSFRFLMDQAYRLKNHIANVLIYGESGTGKELLARHIHSLEEKNHRPFIAVNCAAIPEGLIESELFGHERGSFTGALGKKIGKFELANGGDIFLDEISSLKLDLQAKILRVLQEKEIVRVGGNTHIPVNFRVLSATNENIYEMVNKGTFRVDLYHRLKVVELHIPPLRERKEDISMLVAYFLDKFGKSRGPKKISAEALRLLQQYPWPGNVRELENVIHGLTILSPGEVITSQHLPQCIKISTGMETIDKSALATKDEMILLPEDLATVKYRDFVKEAEKIFIKRALEHHNGDKTKTATMLNMGRTTLYGKLKELNLLD